MAIEALQRIGLKVFAADGASVRPREFVPVFHRWIQTQAVRDHLLIDVADYEHVPGGPGVLLVAHEGNFSVDLGDGRMGLAYNRKAPLAGTLAERLTIVARALLDACRLLESDPDLDGRVRFRGDQLYLFANDRLHAPNTAATLAEFQPALHAFLRTVYGEEPCTVVEEADAQARFGVRVTTHRPLSAGELRKRLG